MDSQKKPGTLFLLPNALNPALDNAEMFPACLERIVHSLQGLIVENEKEGRVFLKRFQKLGLPMALLNEHTDQSALQSLLEPLLKGENWGLISDCGMPCIADPGETLVYLAKRKEVPVEIVMGPSSIFMALALSGLPSERFCFYGYLPRDEKELTKLLISLEKRATLEKTTYLFIEAPYRSNKLLSVLLQTLSSNMLLCVATDLMFPSQLVVTKTLTEWKKMPPLDLNKRPTLFLFSGAF